MCLAKESSPFSVAAASRHLRHRMVVLCQSRDYPTKAAMIAVRRFPVCQDFQLVGSGGGMSLTAHLAFMYMVPRYSSANGFYLMAHIVESKRTSYFVCRAGL